MDIHSACSQLMYGCLQEWCRGPICQVGSCDFNYLAVGWERQNHLGIDWMASYTEPLGLEQWGGDADGSETPRKTGASDSSASRATTLQGCQLSCTWRDTRAFRQSHSRKNSHSESALFHYELDISHIKSVGVICKPYRLFIT